LQRRNFLGHFLTITFAASVSGVCPAQPASISPSFARSGCDIVLHKGWVFRRSDLRDGVRMTAFASDAL